MGMGVGGWGAEWGEDLKRDAVSVCSGLRREDEFIASSGKAFWNTWHLTFQMDSEG